MRQKDKRTILLAMMVILAMLVSSCGPFSRVQGTKEVTDVPEIQNEANVDDQYGLIVLGGEPEGIAAAIAAARNGVKTLLLCEEKDLGGLYTLGQLNFIDVPETRQGKVLVDGIYGDFFDAVSGSGFDINAAKKTFYDMVVAQPNITLRVESTFDRPIMEGTALQGVWMQEDNETRAFYADYLIDATTDGDLAEAAGAPYTFAGEDIGEKDRHMGVTLVFGLSGVDWNKVLTHLTGQRAKGEITGGATEMGAVGNTAWGYTREGFAYEPKDPAMRLRGFNIARQADGTVLLNALIIFDVDVLDEASKAEGIRRGQEELKHIVPYLQETCVGFEKAKLAGTAEMLYVRESRHFDCETMLTIDDVLENRDQWDKVCVSNYPVDVQPTKEQTYGTVVGFPDQYAISYRSLVPKQVENLLLVGRSAGYHSMAAGSARIVPTGMGCAEGAGTAVAVAKEQDKTPRELCNDADAMARLQSLLTEQGALLAHTQTEETVMSHWAYGGLKTLRSLGLVDGGYDNNYHLDEPITMNRYQNMINNVLKKTGFAPEEKIYVNENPPVRQIIGTMARAVADAEGIKLENNHEVYMQALRQRGIMTAELQAYFVDQEKNPNQAEVVVLSANCYRYLITLPGAQQLTAVSGL